MVVGAKVCGDLTEDLLWFVCGNFDAFPCQTRVYCKNMRNKAYQQIRERLGKDHL